MEIRAVEKKSAVDAAIDGIRDYILNNRLGPGASLPPEQELALALGVSRNILREAMRHYRTLGIIESRPKLGAVIASLIPANPFAGYYSFIADGRDSLAELAQLRNCIEHGAARFVLAAITDGDIAELEDLADKLSSSKTPAEMYDLDLRFHSKLLEIPRNRLLEGLIPLLMDFFDELRRRRGDTARFQMRDQIAARHRRIVEALKSGDITGLEKAIDEHNPRAFVKVGK